MENRYERHRRTRPRMSQAKIEPPKPRHNPSTATPNAPHYTCPTRTLQVTDANPPAPARLSPPSLSRRLPSKARSLTLRLHKKVPRISSNTSTPIHLSTHSRSAKMPSGQGSTCSAPPSVLSRVGKEKTVADDIARSRYEPDPQQEGQEGGQGSRRGRPCVQAEATGWFVFGPSLPSSTPAFRNM